MMETKSNDVIERLSTYDWIDIEHDEWGRAITIRPSRDKDSFEKHGSAVKTRQGRLDTEQFLKAVRDGDNESLGAINIKSQKEADRDDERDIFEPVKKHYRLNRDGNTTTWFHYELPLPPDKKEGGETVYIELEVPKPSPVIEGFKELAEEPIDKRPSLLLEESTLTDLEPARSNRVAGLKKQKERLQQFLSSTAEEWGLPEERGMLLKGPPGTGKTELTLEVCEEEFGKVPVTISGPEILSKWVGESEKVLRNKFKEAWSREKGRVIYIDEIDAIAQAREDSSDNYSTQIVSQLLVLLDGIEAKREVEENGPFKVIASTNVAHTVDPALKRPNRLGSEAPPFELPDYETRLTILHHHLQKIYQKDGNRLSDNLQDFIEKAEITSDLEALIENTVDFSGADLENLVINTAKKVSAEIDSANISIEDLQENLENLEKSNYGVSSENLSKSSTDLSTSSEKRINKLVGEGEFRVIRVDTEAKMSEKVKSIGQLYSQNIQDKTAKWRELKLNHALDADWTRTKENVIEAFAHSEDESICLYVPEFEYLYDSREASTTLHRLFGLIHEQVLAWDKDNLLIVNSSQETGLPGETLIEL